MDIGDGGVAVHPGVTGINGPEVDEPRPRDYRVGMDAAPGAGRRPS